MNDQKRQSVIPGLIASLVILLAMTGLFSLGRLLPRPLPWWLITIPLWMTPLILIAGAGYWKLMGGNVFKDGEQENGKRKYR